MLETAKETPKEAWEFSPTSVPEELRLLNLDLFGTYNLTTLVDFGVVTLPVAVRISGQELWSEHAHYLKSFAGLSQDGKVALSPEELLTLAVAPRVSRSDYPLNSVIVDSDLVRKLNEAGMEVPQGKRQLFGENFSTLTEYNRLLNEPIMTGTDATSVTAKKALVRHFDMANPIPHSFPRDAGSLQELVERADRDDYVGTRTFDYDLKGYTQNQIAKGRRLLGEVAPELSASLRQIAERVRRTGHWSSEGESTYILALVDNAGLLFKAYLMALSFKRQFKQQVEALDKLYRMPFEKPMYGHTLDEHRSYITLWNMGSIHL